MHVRVRVRSYQSGEARLKQNFYHLAKDNIITVLFTWQMVAHTAQLNEMVRLQVTPIDLRPCLTLWSAIYPNPSHGPI